MTTGGLETKQPHDITEALTAMQDGLDYFHQREDDRAVFLRLYYVMTREVQAAVEGLGDYKGRQVFLDADWIRRLSGHFAGLYFRSLSTFTRDRDESVEGAWKVAYRTAAHDDSTVVQNALCGINAHINFDLSHAIALNLREHRDLRDPAKLAIRKFDHDQVNNLLVRSLPYIQFILARDYGPGIGLIDQMLGSLDERVSDYGLKYYRERVWGDAIAYAAALDIGQEDVVRQKLDWESHRIAKVLTDRSGLRRSLWWPERIAVGLRGVPSYRGIDLEPEGGVSFVAPRTLHPFR